MNDFINLIRKVKTVPDAVKLLELNADIDEDVERAIDFAILAHEGQYRKSGEPYIIHPILVATIVASISNDKTMIIAALLHDVVEDTKYENCLLYTSPSPRD